MHGTINVKKMDLNSSGIKLLDKLSSTLQEHTSMYKVKQNEKSKPLIFSDKYMLKASGNALSDISNSSDAV
jgi:hypothetical protein